MLLSSAYLPPVWYFTKLLLCDGHEVQIEQWDHYVKQTYRNRCIIGNADGMLPLTVPTEKAETPKCYMRDVRISDHGNWRHQHWNALEAAYGQTPFFLYYEDDFRPFYEKRFEFLFDFNLQLTALCCELIDIHPVLCPTEVFAETTSLTGVSSTTSPTGVSSTTSLTGVSSTTSLTCTACHSSHSGPTSFSNQASHTFSDSQDEADFRELIHPKRAYTSDPTFSPAPYWQVFADRFGFRPNLSIVDLLFNMGPESIFVLQKSIPKPKPEIDEP